MLFGGMFIFLNPVTHLYIFTRKLQRFIPGVTYFCLCKNVCYQAFFMRGCLILCIMMKAKRDKASG